MNITTAIDTTDPISSSNNSGAILMAESDTRGAYRLEAFNFTKSYGLNYYINDYDDLMEQIGDDEIEFWLLEENTGSGFFGHSFVVKDFNALEELIEALETESSEDVKQWLDIVDDGFASNLESAKDWHEEHLFASETFTDLELGYYMVEQGFIEIPDHLESYFDHERYGRDCSFDLVEIGGCFYWNH